MELSGSPSWSLAESNFGNAGGVFSFGAVLRFGNAEFLRSTEATDSGDAVRDSGDSTRTVMKCGWDLSQESAASLDSKNRSITTAFRCAAVRAHERAAARLTTAGPLSTARQVASGNWTRLPYGIRFGSTAQWPLRNRAPLEQARTWPLPGQ